MTRRMSRGKTASGTANHRHAHPQRLTRCQSARVGLRVQSQIDSAILSHRIEIRRPTLQKYSIRRDAPAAEFAMQPLLGIGLIQTAVLEQQPGTWRAAQNRAPRIECL